MRREGWPEALAATVEAARAESFAWGEHDCCLFVANAVRATTGRDIAEGLRGSYRSERGAWRALRRRGWAGLEECFDALLGERVAPLTARRGDVALFEGGRGPTVGIVLGSAIAATGPGGMEFVPLGRARVAWRV